MQVRALLVLATAALLTAACGNSESAGDASAAAGEVSTAVDVPLPELEISPVATDGPVERQIADFVAANNLPAPQTTASGLAYVIEAPGSEERPTVQDEITIYYHGYLTSGKTFDRTKSEPRTFPLNALIPAWQEAIPMIGRGGRIKIFAPPSTAYGQNPPPGTGITPQSVLVFDIGLVDF